MLYSNEAFVIHASWPVNCVLYSLSEFYLSLWLCLVSIYLFLFLLISACFYFSLVFLLRPHRRTRHYCVVVISYISVTRDAFCRCRYYQFSWTASKMGSIHISSQRIAIILLYAFEKSVNIPYHRCYTYEKSLDFNFSTNACVYFYAFVYAIRLAFFIPFQLLYRIFAPAA